MITILAGIGTLAIFSFLWRENPVFRFFEHLFIGVAAGLLPILTIRNMLWPNVIGPLVGADVAYFPDGTVATPYQYWNLLFALPLFLGLFYYAAFFKRISWLSRLVIGISLGYTAGLSVKGFFAEIVPQVTSSFKPLVVMNSEGSFEWFASFNNVVFVTTLLLVMFYFFSTFKEAGKVSHRARVYGRYMMMICFGSFFGSTVMARMALLVERIQFLAGDWWLSLKHLF